MPAFQYLTVTHPAQKLAGRPLKALHGLSSPALKCGLTRWAIAATLALGGNIAAPQIAAANDVTISGPYLSARAAEGSNDFAQALRDYDTVLSIDPDSAAFLEGALIAAISSGDMARVADLSTRLLVVEPDAPNALMAQFGLLAAKADWNLAVELLANHSINPLLDGALKGWAELGAGKMSDALASFDALAAQPGLSSFANYQKALALSVVGDFEGSLAIFNGPEREAIGLTQRGMMAQIEALSALGRNPEALALFDQVFGTPMGAQAENIRAVLASDGVLPPAIVASARDGAAEAFFSLASVLDGQVSDAIALIYGQMAVLVRPDLTDGLIFNAQMQERLGNHDQVALILAQVSPDQAQFPSAEMLRAEALQQSGQTGVAIEVLRALTVARPDMADPLIALGDMLRAQDDHAGAVEAYSRAIDILGTPQPGHWVLYFTRGISFERLKDWPKAEADFRQSLALFPDQPQVLNYIGYSFVDMNQNLDEALDMIERAVRGRPDDGFITDSLGWVYYRVGRYDEAVIAMERAVELEPVDPIITDHLGDVYWAVGRTREARFQWRRALSFKPEDKDATRIRRKLEVGLDVVLAEEGGDPIK